MSVNALNTATGAQKQYAKGPPSDASAVTAMRRAAVITNFQNSTTNPKRLISDRNLTRGFEGSGIMAVKATGLYKNFLRTL
jgi:hypothetical protein